MKVKFTELNSGYTGYNRVSRFSQKTRSKMIIAGILASVFIFVYILSSVGLIPVDALSARLSSFVSQDVENFPLRVDTDSIINTKIVGDRILVLTVEDLTVYSSGGREVYTQTHNYASPTISVNGDKAVVFDRGHKGYMLINEKKVVFTGEASGNIICAEYGSGGNYALGTIGETSTSVLTVFSPTNKVSFQWNCAYEHIVSVALSSNGKFAGVAIAGAENGEMFTCVKYFGFDYQEPLNSQTIKSASALGLEFTAVNTLTLFSNTGVYTIEKKGETYESVVEYYSSEFNSYDFSSQGKYVISLAKYGSANDFLITVYSGKGRQKTEISADYTIKSVSMSDKYIFALAEKCIMVYNLNGRKISQVDFKGDAKSIFATDKFLFINSLDKITRCFSYGDSAVELSM